MPVPMLKKLAKQAGKPLEEVEKIWEESKPLAAKKFKADSPHYYPYLVGIVKRRLGLHHATTDDGDNEVGWNTLTAPTSTRLDPHEVDRLVEAKPKIRQLRVLKIIRTY